jgi:hypothetical protein
MTTYQASAITANTDIPALVATFAASLGFTTTSVSSTEKTVQHPTFTGAKVFTIRTNNIGAAETRRERVELQLNVTGSIVAWAESPKMNPTSGNTAGSVVVSQPTKLHLYGKLSGGSSDSGKTYIAGIIEYGFNLYRHFYMGYIEKLSSFAGGEVITGSSYCPVPITSFNDSIVKWDNSYGNGYISWPFTAENTGYGPVNISNGGLYLDPALKTNPWSSFNTNGNAFSNTDIHNSFAAFGDQLVIGGFGDSINTGYMNAGKSPYAGAQILTPVNLYVGKRATGVQYFQAVGRAAGVRLVHMEDLDPGSTITIGSSTWRVFPLFRKSAAPSVPIKGYATVSTPYCFPSDNTSLYAGMAYEEVE